MEVYPLSPVTILYCIRLPMKDWYEQAQLVQATDVDRRGAVPMEIIWEQKGFLGRQSERRTAIIGTHVSLNGKNLMLVPSDAFVLPEKAIAENAVRFCEGFTRRDSQSFGYGIPAADYQIGLE